MARDYDRSHLFTRRAVLLGGAKLAIFSVLMGRIYYLQVIQGEKYKTLADENRINLRLIAPPRGQILDRNGTPVAMNQQNYRLVLLPDQVENMNNLLDRVSTYLPLTEADRKRILRDVKNDRSLNAVLIRDNVTWDQVASLSLHSLDLPGTDIEMGEVRTYPYTTSTAHILGYIGTPSEKDLKDDDDDEPIMSAPGFRIGKSGVEKYYDRLLRGTAGTVNLEVNAHGRVVRELARREPQIGNDLKLTIDIGLQEYAANRLKDEESAAAVVMDVQTGAIRCLISHPGFDPNLFTYGIAQDDWEKLNTDIHTPLLNKVVNGAYAPGSTFKPVVALAALDAGIVDPNATVFCPGYYDLGEHRFHCWKHGGHGHMNLKDAMAGSCDTYFYDLGKRVGIDRMQAMAKRLGLGQKLGVDLPQERSGLIPGRAWKLALHAGLWRQGDTLVSSIGQGSTLTTPLQLAVMAARIANGGKAVTPRLVMPDHPLPPFSDLGLDPKNLGLVQEAMAAVLQPGGTAYASRILDDKQAMAGKSGSAQVRRISMAERETGVIKNEALPWQQRDHALFIAYAPVVAPRFSVAVVIEHGGSGGHVAAPIARDLLIETMKRM
jgi:penicillin-binding protein 2